MSEDGELEALTEQDSTSVLGIMWNYRTDEFQFKVHSRSQPDVLTKRLVTSEAGRIFDPQGYLAPITIRSKLFIQRLWDNRRGTIRLHVSFSWNGEHFVMNFSR